MASTNEENRMERDASECSTLEGSGYSMSMSFSDKDTGKSIAMSSLGMSSLSNDNTIGSSHSLSDVIHARRRELDEDEEVNDVMDGSLSGRKLMERRMRRQGSQGSYPRRARKRMSGVEDEKNKQTGSNSLKQMRQNHQRNHTALPAVLTSTEEGDDSQSIVSLSGKNIVERKQRKQVSIARMREKSQNNGLLLNHSITIITESKPGPSSSSTNRPMLDHSDNYSFATTIATRDDDDDSVLLSPIQESSSAAWKRARASSLKKPERKVSLGMASVAEEMMTPPDLADGSFASQDSDDDDDDDDEESLSPLQVNFPKQKAQQALHWHMSQPICSIAPPPLHNLQDAKPSRRPLFHKAKSVSNLNLEQQLMALPDKSDNDSDFWKIQVSPARTQPPTKKINSLERQRDGGVPQTQKQQRRGSCRSLSPVKNRWITGCEDDIHPESKGEWQLASPVNDKNLVFKRAGTGALSTQNTADSHHGFCVTPQPNRIKKDNATLPSRRPSLSKSKSSPNLNASFLNDCDAIGSNGNPQTVTPYQPLPVQKIESIVSFLLGEGLQPQPKDVEEKNRESASNVDKKTELRSVREDDSFNEEDIQDHLESANNALKEGNHEDGRIFTQTEIHDLLLPRKFDDAKPCSLEELLSEPPSVMPTATNANAPIIASVASTTVVPSSGVTMEDPKKKATPSPSLMKKIKTATRYLRKKKVAGSDADPFARLNQSMSAFDNNFNSSFIGSSFTSPFVGTIRRGGKVSDEEAKDEAHGCANNLASVAGERSPPDNSSPTAKQKKDKLGAKLRNFAFLRATSVPLLVVNNESTDEETEAVAAVVQDQTKLPKRAVLHFTLNEATGRERNTKSQPLSPMGATPVSSYSPRNTPKRKPQMVKSASLRDLRSSPKGSSRQSSSQRLPVKTGHKSITRERPSLKSLDDNDLSSLLPSKSQRNKERDPHKSKRETQSTLDAEQSIASTPKEKRRQAKSSASKSHKEKPRHGRPKASSPSRSPRPRSKLNSSLTETSLNSQSETDPVDSGPHLAGRSPADMKHSRREGGPQTSSRRPSSHRTLDEPSRRSSSMKRSLASSQTARDRLAESSRDVEEGRGKVAATDEASLPSVRAAGKSSKTKLSPPASIVDEGSGITLTPHSSSRRSSRMKLGSKAMSERHLGASVSTIDNHMDRLKARTKRPSESRRGNGSFQGLLGHQQQMKKSSSARHLNAHKDLLDDEDHVRPSETRMGHGSYHGLLSPPFPMKKASSSRQLISGKGLMDEEDHVRRPTSAVQQTVRTAIGSSRLLTASSDEEDGLKRIHRPAGSRLVRNRDVPTDRRRRMKKSQSLRQVDG